MNDVFDTLEEVNSPFDYQVFPLIGDENDLVLSNFGFEATDIFGSRWHNIEAIASSKRVLKDILHYKPDVLHVGGVSRVELVLTGIISSVLDIPVVLGPNIGGWYPMRRTKFWSGDTKKKISNWSNYLETMMTLRLNDPERVLAFSEYHKLMIRSVWDKNKIDVLYPAVHNRFHPDESIKREIDILYVGNLSEQKGYFTFVDVLEKLDNQYSLKVDIVGGYPEESPPYETIDVEYHGFQPRDKLPQIYNRAKLFVCLSSDEMGPNTLIEALSCGTPALVNDEPGLNEYLQDGNGILCDRTDLNDVVTNFEAALENQDQLLQSAADSAECYNISNTISQIYEIYSEVLDSCPESD
mgnify:FL=1